MIRFGLVGPLAAAFAFVTPTPASAQQQVKVSVVAIVASETNPQVDKQLRLIADEIRKRTFADRLQTGRRTTTPVQLGKKESFPLVDELSAVVQVEPSAQPNFDYRVMLKPPTTGEITYDCKKDKYFPIVTRHQTPDKGRLIVAVMVTP